MPFNWKRKSYQNINEYNIRINNLNGTFQIIAANLAIPFATMFAKRLSATDFQVALLSSLPAIVSVGAIIPGAIFVQKSHNKKQVTGMFFILTRVFYLLFSLVPFMAKQYRASMFILLYGFMNLPGSIATVAWQSFIADLFPPFLIGHALALRNRLSTFLGIGITLITGLALYNIPGNDAERIILYQIFFIAAFLFAIIEIYMFYKHKVPKREEFEVPEQELKIDNPAAGNVVKNLKSNKKFIIFCLCSMVFYFSWYMGWPLFSLYEIDYLHSNEMWTSLITSINGIAAAVTFTYWSKFAQRKGSSLALTVSVLAMAFVPLLYPVTRSIYALLPLSIIGGISTSGIQLLFLNTLYEVAPAENRTMHIAYFNTMTNVLLAIAPFTGIALKNAFNIYNALIITGLMRLFAGFIFLIKLRNEKRIRL